VSHRREQQKAWILESDAAANEIYSSPWVTFKTILSLLDKIKPINTQKKKIKVSVKRVFFFKFYFKLLFTNLKCFCKFQFSNHIKLFFFIISYTVILLWNISNSFKYSLICLSYIHSLFSVSVFQCSDFAQWLKGPYPFFIVWLTCSGVSIYSRLISKGYHNISLTFYREIRVSMTTWAFWALNNIGFPASWLLHRNSECGHINSECSKKSVNEHVYKESILLLVGHGLKTLSCRGKCHQRSAVYSQHLRHQIFQQNNSSIFTATNTQKYFLSNEYFETEWQYLEFIFIFQCLCLSSLLK
jgi:uncharacterized protein YecT (DUF1311 family)